MLPTQAHTATPTGETKEPAPNTSTEGGTFARPPVIIYDNVFECPKSILKTYFQKLSIYVKRQKKEISTTTSSSRHHQAAQKATRWSYRRSKVLVTQLAIVVIFVKDNRLKDIVVVK